MSGSGGTLTRVPARCLHTLCVLSLGTRGCAVASGPQTSARLSQLPGDTRDSGRSGARGYSLCSGRARSKLGKGGRWVGDAGGVGGELSGPLSPGSRVGLPVPRMQCITLKTPRGLRGGSDAASGSPVSVSVGSTTAEAYGWQSGHAGCVGTSLWGPASVLRPAGCVPLGPRRPCLENRATAGPHRAGLPTGQGSGQGSGQAEARPAGVPAAASPASLPLPWSARSHSCGIPVCFRGTGAPL